MVELLQQNVDREPFEMAYLQYHKACSESQDINGK